MKMSLSNAPVWPPLPTVQEQINKYVKMIDAWTNKKILAGFDYEVGGITYHFSYDLYDQNNFAQANSKAIMSLTLGNTSEDELKATYGTLEDGSLNKDALPVPLPDEWTQVWQGHIDQDGMDNSVSITFNVNDFLALANAAGAHNQKQLGIGWTIKTALRSAATTDELKALVKQYEVEEKYREATQDL